MQLKSLLVIFLILNFTFLKNSANDSYYLLFNKESNCSYENKKIIQGKKILFQIIDCKNKTIESFSSNSLHRIDTLNITNLASINIYSIERLNELNLEERNYLFNNIDSIKSFKSSFEMKPIYILERLNNHYLKYKVEWISKDIQVVIED